MAGERVVPGLGLETFHTLGSNGWKPDMDRNLWLLSLVCQASITSVVSSLPGSPLAGQRHIITTGANAQQIAVYDRNPIDSETGGWVYIVPNKGWIVVDNSNGAVLRFNGATWDSLLSAANVKTIYESNADTNAFTDAEKTKLTNIEALAKDDQTGAEIVALLDTELGSAGWRALGAGDNGGIPLGFAFSTPIPATPAWTAQNSGTPDTAAWAHGVVDIAHSGDDGLTKMYIPLAAGDFDIVLKTRHNQPNDSFSMAGVFLSASAGANPMIGWGLFWNGDIYQQKWNGTTFVSETSKVASVVTQPTSNQDIYWRLVLTGTSLAVSYSLNGLSWTAVETIADITAILPVPNRIGVFMSSGGVAGLSEVELIGMDYDGPQEEQEIGVGEIYNVEVTASRDLTDFDFNGALRLVCNSGTDITLNLPTNLFAKGAVHISRKGTGAVAISYAAGVEVRAADGILTLRHQHSGGTIIPEGLDSYSLIGDFG